MHEELFFYIGGVYMPRKKQFKPKFKTYEEIQNTINQATQMLIKGELTYNTHKAVMVACREAMRVLEQCKELQPQQDNRLILVWNDLDEDEGEIDNETIN